MFDYRSFDVTFDFNPEYSYSSPAVITVDTNRRSLEGLFVDKILRLFGIKRPAKLYPPKTNAELRALHQSIVGANAADHTKLSLLYYILLDCDVPTRRQDYSDSFEERSFLPKRYQIFMKGIWHMDHLEFELALQYLTHPSLIPTFHEDILEALVKHSKNNDFSLPLAYYHTVQPILQKSMAVESLFSAIARTSVNEAYYFCQSQTDATHHQMFQDLIATVLSGPPNENTGARAIELVNLPFTAEEEVSFETYLHSGEGRGLARAKDTLMMRRIATSRFSQALSVKDLGGTSIGGLGWEMMQQSLVEGLGPRI